MSDQAVIKAYQKVFEHTQIKCVSCTRLSPYRCCDPMYCVMTISYAREKWGMNLEPTGHPTLPLMGEDNMCVAAPHLRPLCTLEQCKINSFGFYSGDPQWTEEYFRLRGLVNIAEVARTGKGNAE